MHRKTRAAFQAALILFLATNVASAQDAVIRIGHAGPITGQGAHLGKDSENGARLAIDALNARPVLIAGKPVRFILQAEDDSGDPRLGTTVAQKLVDAKIQGMVGHFNSGTTIPASRIYTQAGIPQISPAATSPKYTRQGYPTAFRVAANDTQLGSALARHATQELRAKRIAIIDDRTAYGQGLADEFANHLKGVAAVSIVSHQYTSDKATDLNAILTTIKSRQPDLIFFGGMDAVAGPLLRQMEQLGITAPLLGGGGICNQNLVQLAGGQIADGQVICALPGGVDASGEKELESFKSAYKKRFGIDVLWVAAYAFDAVNALADAMQRAGSAEQQTYLPVLAASHYQGITGLISFTANGDLNNAAVTLYSFKDNQRKQIAITRGQ